MRILALQNVYFSNCQSRGSHLPSKIHHTVTLSKMLRCRSQIPFTLRIAISGPSFELELPHDYTIRDLKWDISENSKIARKNVQLSHKGKLLPSLDEDGYLNTILTVGIRPGQTIIASSKLDGISETLNEYEEDEDW